MAEKEKRAPRHERMYSKKPTLGRDEEGNVAVTEGRKESDKTQAGMEDVKMHESKDPLPMHTHHAHERRELKHQHIHEHHTLHHRHQVEHSHHDHGEHGDKHELHARHLEQLAELHKKHFSEHNMMYSRHEKELNGVEKRDQDIKENKPAEKAEATGKGE